MQENTAKACIHGQPPYLRHSLKLDNLPLICNNLSEKVLHRSEGCQDDHYRRRDKIVARVFNGIGEGVRL